MQRMFLILASISARIFLVCSVSLHPRFHSIRYERVLNNQRQVLILDMDCVQEQLFCKTRLIYIYFGKGCPKKCARDNPER